MIPFRSRSGATLTRLALTFFLVGLLGSGCSNKEMETENQQLKAEVKELNDAAAAKEQFNQELAKSMDSVQNALEEVRQKEVNTLHIANKMDPGQNTDTAKREQMLENINGIRQLLDQRKDELDKLEARLGKLKGDNTGMVKTIARLRKIIADREGQIKKLEEAVQDRDAKIAIMDTLLGEKTQLIEAQGGQIKEKEAVIQQQETVLNTGYYIAGKKDFLKEKGIVKDVGGVLGLGKSQVATGYPDELFTAVPIQTTSEIPLACAPGKIKVISSHPTDSFSIEAAGPDASSLKIKDATNFWKTRYLVIMLRC